MTESLARAAFSVAYACLLTCYFAAIAGRSLFPMGTTLFVLWQSAAFLGTILLLDATNLDAAFLRLSQMMVGMTMFVLGAALANISAGFNPRIAIPRFRREALVFDLYSGVYALVVGILVVSVGVGLLYARSLGGSVLLNALEEYARTGSISDSAKLYATGRRTVHGTEGVWLGTGYALQFTAVLVPLSVYLLYVRASILRRRRDWFVLVAVLPIAVYLLTATGMRDKLLVFVITFVSLTTSRWGILGESAGPGFIARVVTVVGVGLLVVTTLLSGRVGSEFTLGGAIARPVLNLVERIIIIPSRNQLAYLSSFDHDLLRWGRGWLDSLRTALPGRQEHVGSGTRLSFVLRGDAGTSAPADLWTSIWWNFGWVGIAYIPLVGGLICQRFTCYFFRARKILSRGVVMYAGFFAVARFSEPISLLNDGVVTLMVFYSMVVVVKSLQKRLGAAQTYGSAPKAESTSLGILERTDTAVG